MSINLCRGSKERESLQFEIEGKETKENRFTHYLCRDGFKRMPSEIHEEMISYANIMFIKENPTLVFGSICEVFDTVFEVKDGKGTFLC